MSLKAGAARVDISPGKPAFLVGYPHVPRISTGVHDPLYATALCLRNSSDAVLFISTDVLFVTHETVRECRRAIHEAVGIQEGSILISATHTHSGPVTFEYLSMRSDPVVPPPDPEYMAFFADALVRVGVEAWRKAEPARCSVSCAHAEGVGGNRLNAGGTADSEVGILYVIREKDESPLALSMVYSMHPTVLHEDSTLVSSDFPGFTRQRIAEELPGVVVLYHTGPAGNQSPRHHVCGQTFAEAERLGNRLGNFVVEAVRRIEPKSFDGDPILSARQAFVDLPVRRFVSIEAAERLRVEAVKRYDDLKLAMAGHGAVRTAECVVFGAEELVVLARAQETGEIEDWRRRQLPAEVQAIRVGDSVWAGLRGELFVEYGMDIKRRASGQVFPISLANGELQGYIVTPEADAAGGYEAACSFYEPAAGRIIVDKALDVVRDIMGIRLNGKKRLAGGVSFR